MGTGALLIAVFGLAPSGFSAKINAGDSFMKSLTHLTIILLTSSILSACATNRTRMREGDNTGQEAALTPAEEAKMTQEVLPQMMKEYPPVQNPELQAYVRKIGTQLVTANHLEGKPYHYTFAVVDVDYVNAFALPAGTIFVTAPLIAMADSEAELAGVIGHEIGHVVARHTAERMYQAKKEESKSLLYGVGGGLLGAAAGFGIGKLACKGDSACLAKAAAIGAGAGAAGGLLVQKFAFMANSREDEMEADRIGFNVAVQGGYSKDHVGLFYSKLYKLEQARGKAGGPISALTDALSTHPPSRERVAQMDEMARTGTPRKAEISGTEFPKMRSLAQRSSKRAR